ncbi:MAG TPA: prepilin-type N-terminal cleavage/methylation domain-containing protein [Thermoanaerobaculia bacterium]|nr:prepilin-type N-terminal cleavage/methylation domain-containing protein [Thermoanaerobaculia bacterium]
MAIPSGPSKPGQGGFTLLEALIALVLLGVALLLGMELVLQNPLMVRRMDDERQAFRAMEATLESVRAGTTPLVTADLDRYSTAVGKPARSDLEIDMTVDRTDVPGLYQVTLRARYTADKRKVQKELQTMVWSPPKS